VFLFYENLSVGIMIIALCTSIVIS